MARVKPSSLPREDRNKLLDELWTMIALLETREEVKNFFKDLLSETEAVMLGRRIQIARLLLQGMGYEEIARQLRASEGTIALVHRWLQGGFGGYEKLMPRLEKELDRRRKIEGKKIKQRDVTSIEWLKKRYPLHFLLLNTIDSFELRAPKKLRKGRR